MRRVLFTFFLVLFVALPAGAAEAAGGRAVGVLTSSVNCGDTVLVSIRLTHDLVNCPGTGLVIGADHVTIDLAGHTIDGVNAPGSEGISVDKHTDIHVKNGVITDFFANGVALRDAPGSSVTNLHISQIGAGGVEGDGSAGILVKNSPRAVVTGNTVTNDVVAYQSDGVDVAFSPYTVVSGNRLNSNSWDGMFVLESPHSKVMGNQLSYNQNHGMEVNIGSDSIVVCGNRASGNAVNGLVVGAVAHSRVSHNVTSDNGRAGLLFFDLVDSVISTNRASGNAVGIGVIGGQNGSTGNRISHNDTSRNHGVGMALEGQANHNLLERNTANANEGGPGSGGGFVIVASSDNSLVGNAASRNLAVGIGIYQVDPGDSTGNSLKGNVANKNAEHGIEVVEGTVDLGGNRAHDNTALPNCIGVVCV